MIRYMSQRDSSIDVLRGIVVFLMVSSHVVWLLSLRQNPYWDTVRSFGDAVCYITFLFVFGISSYFSLFAKEYSPFLKAKALNKIWKLLLAYYLIAFASVAKDLVTHFDKRIILEVLTFYKVPGFTEFLVPFLFYSIVLLLFKSRDVFTDNLFENKETPRFLLLFSASLFILGTLLAGSNDVLLPNIFTPYITQLTGGGNLLRFSLLHYFGVPLLGVYFGYFIYHKKENLLRKKLGYSIVVTLVASFALIASARITPLRGINSLDRWPPSILFLLLGLLFSFVTLFVLRLRNPGFMRYFAYIGNNAIYVLVIHILILRALEFFNFQKTDNTYSLAFWFLIILNVPLLLKVVVYDLPKRRKVKENFD
jgi:fucose 4-O-acetylase-like acetyltransferase